MKLIDADAIIRSKNAGPFRITLDVIFKNRRQFEAMERSGLWSRENLADLYHLRREDIIECLVYEPALAFKCTYQRAVSSGAFGDTDIYGSQEHLPLYSLEIPEENGPEAGKEAGCYREPEKILEPGHTALILVDMQEDFCSQDGKFAQAGRDISAVQAIIPNCEALLTGAREAGVFVVHLQQCTLPGQKSDSGGWLAFKTRDGKSAEYALLGSGGARPVAALAPVGDEVVIQKFRPSGFHGTFLDQILRANGVESVLICGTTTEGCVMATVLDASFHDYYTCVVEDGVATSVQNMQETAMAFMKTRYKTFTVNQILEIWR